MKKSIVGITVAAVVFAISLVWYSCTQDEEIMKGTIYGTVTDYNNGQPIGNASVKLRPSGETTITGSDGSYEFKDLDAGKYSLMLSKAGYADLDDDYIIELEAGKKVKRDVQMRQKVASLKILDMNGNPLDTLDFGSDESVVVKTFNLFNDGTESMTCAANEECEWITNVSGLENPIQPGQTAPVTVRIDRVALDDGVNVTFLYITSGNGSNGIVVKATFLGTVVMTTTNASSVGATSATLGGNITDDGGRPVLERGICYGTSQSPDINGDHTQDGSGTGTFSHNITGLNSSTTYYARAYATNRNGTYYASNIVSFTTTDGLPTVTTTAVSDITATTAKSGGNVTNNGGFNVTARGICWNTMGSPDLNDQHTTNGSGNGEFTSNMTGLTAGTTYYVRAYATNTQGTSYGAEQQFTALDGAVSMVLSDVENITATTAVCTAEITGDGGSAVTERGICWSTTQYPTTGGFHLAAGSGIGSFTVPISGLIFSSTYYVRAYAVNAVGTSYSNQISFTTANGLPTVSTGSASNITAVSATCSGSITSDGGYNVTARGFCWNTTGNPDLNDPHSTNGSGVGMFTGSLTNLTANTTYHVRAYATNSTGTSYGNEISFSTMSGSIVLTTSSVNNITGTTASCGGNITDDGGSAVTARGICWGTVYNPTLSDNSANSGSGTGSFSANMTGLTPNVTYHVRAYATNAQGTCYGNDVSFETQSGSVSITLSNATNITATSATCSVTITDDGGATITERGICWSTAQYPTTTNQYVSVGAGTGTFSASMSNLTPATTYYVRAYAVNAAGTSYSSQISFSTPSGLPVVNFSATSGVTDITATSAEAYASVYNDGGFPITAKGFCWSTSPAPTISNDHSINGSGLGGFYGSMTDLSANTTYYVRAYATNSIGTAYSIEANFTTEDGRPTVVTTPVTLSGETANTGGNISSDNGFPITARGICYGPLPNPDLSSSFSHTIDGTGTGYFSSQFSLPMGSGTYYVRAYATNSNGTSYGQQETIIQPYDELPSFTYDGHTYKVAPSTNNYSYSAAEAYCSALTYCGYSDWRLPTEGEMLQMCAQKNTIGGFMVSDHDSYTYVYGCYRTSAVGDSTGQHKVILMVSCTSSSVPDDLMYYQPNSSLLYIFRVRPIRMDD